MLTTSGMNGMATAASISLMCSLLILLTQRWHGAHSLDTDMAGAQKFHKTPVPRIGGVALMLGLLGAFVITRSQAMSPEAVVEAETIGWLILAAVPAFFAGLREDLTKKVPVLMRLLATFASPLLASWMIGATLPRIDIWGVDLLFQFAPVALFVTAFAVAGVTNSINIIDGFNGLAGFTGTIVLACLGYVAWQVGDEFLLHLVWIGVGAIVGFLLLNYPTGRLFMGDSGAYLLGFWIAQITVLLIARHPEINAWQLLAICFYPVIEVLYSIYRKKVVRKMSPGSPDRLHFHMLVHRRLICCVFRARPSQQPWFRNASTTLAILFFIAPFSIAAALWGDSIPAAIGLIVTQSFVYLAIYARLVRGHWCLNPAVGLGFRSEHRARSG